MSTAPTSGVRRADGKRHDDDEADCSSDEDPQRSRYERNTSPSLSTSQQNPAAFGSGSAGSGDSSGGGVLLRRRRVSSGNLHQTAATASVAQRQGPLPSQQQQPLLAPSSDRFRKRGKPPVGKQPQPQVTRGANRVDAGGEAAPTRRSIPSVVLGHIRHGLGTVWDVLLFVIMGIARFVQTSAVFSAHVAAYVVRFAFVVRRQRKMAAEGGEGLSSSSASEAETQGQESTAGSGGRSAGDDDDNDDAHTLLMNADSAFALEALLAESANAAAAAEGGGVGGLTPAGLRGRLKGLGFSSAMLDKAAEATKGVSPEQEAASKKRHRINRRLRDETASLASDRNLAVHICTWNVGQQEPPANFSTLRSWLLGPSYTPGDPLPDIVAIGLQEVELGGAALMLETTESKVAWTEAITECLNDAARAYHDVHGAIQPAVLVKSDPIAERQRRKSTAISFANSADNGGAHSTTPEASNLEDLRSPDVHSQPMSLGSNGMISPALGGSSNSGGIALPPPFTLPQPRHFRADTDPLSSTTTTTAAGANGGRGGISPAASMSTPRGSHSRYPSSMNTPGSSLLLNPASSMDFEAGGELPPQPQRPQYYRYKKIEAVQLVGMVLLVVARSDHAPNVYHIRTCLSRTGAISGMMGNKGSIGLRFSLYGKRFLLLSAHLDASAHNKERRNANYRDAMTAIRFQSLPFQDDELDTLLHLADNSQSSQDRRTKRTDGRSAWVRFLKRKNKAWMGVDQEEPAIRERNAAGKESRNLMCHDYVFFFGDLNYRLAVPKKSRVNVKQLLTKMSNTVTGRDRKEGAADPGGPDSKTSSTPTEPTKHSVKKWSFFSTAGRWFARGKKNSDSCSVPPEGLDDVGNSSPPSSSDAASPNGSGGILSEEAGTAKAASNPSSASAATTIDVRALASAGRHAELLEYDQLTREMKSGKIFRGFLEQKIAFVPTYKYDKGTLTFDTSRKQRDPAWTDRVLYWSAESSFVGAGTDASSLVLNNLQRNESNADLSTVANSAAPAGDNGSQIIGDSQQRQNSAADSGAGGTTGTQPHVFTSPQSLGPDDRLSSDVLSGFPAHPNSVLGLLPSLLQTDSNIVQSTADAGLHGVSRQRANSSTTDGSANMSVSFNDPVSKNKKLPSSRPAAAAATGRPRALSISELFPLGIGPGLTDVELLKLAHAAARRFQYVHNRVEECGYDAASDILWSDHLPVTAKFNVNVLQIPRHALEKLLFSLREELGLFEQECDVDAFA